MVVIISGNSRVHPNKNPGYACDSIAALTLINFLLRANLSVSSKCQSDDCLLVVVWLSALVLINVVALRWARLILGWVTVCELESRSH